MKSLRLGLLCVIPAVALFFFLAIRLDFLQDDAFISYRYVQNFLNGHGLVYNIGERVEGFTNFGWVVYLIMWGSWGIKYIAISKLTGYALGATLVVMTYFIGSRVFDENNRWFAVVAAYLVAANQSVAYWSPAGLETAAFSVAVAGCFYWWLRSSPLLIWGMTLAVWLRPEGAVICGVIFVVDWIVERQLPKFALRCLISALVLSMPMVAFKLVYYHSIFPNPFYAKTGLGIDQIVHGAQYSWKFLADYGFWGLGLAAGIILWFMGKLQVNHQKVLLALVGYGVYVTLVGGDVLKVHRFYVPMAGASAIILLIGLWGFIKSLSGASRNLILFVVGGCAAALTYWIPNSYVKSYNNSEQGLVYNQGFVGRALREADSTNFSAAATTIGVFGYELIGHRVIDMLGLTDSTIARHPIADADEITSTWRERQYNSRYLLSQSPDYIVFSTGLKPSAPAEKSLFLYRQFNTSYAMLSWYTPAPNGQLTPQINNAYKLVHPITGTIEPIYPIDYVDKMKRGMEYMNAHKYDSSEVMFDAAFRAFPDTPSVPLLAVKGWYCFVASKDAEAFRLFSQCLARDSLCPPAHQTLLFLAYGRKDEAAIRLHRTWLYRLEPWFAGPFEVVVRRSYGLER